ncbi:uncharacterized protein BDZ99DRAFT_519635 [Mytilinidion resinicola]|uniref:Uncharacterized protein n=1 Tax=Mytilinidion resinicola TaxID=574789 RepID=A0A6A6YSS1_9PEZI|nr:uncharacterized protein BDZ99DRAFT_519635 [Mytilinidion resinicola]KAF2810967.1 hypothetical protein BDZ99DRAFT_519635 [Mytilinidion resinicola]
MEVSRVSNCFAEAVEAEVFQDSVIRNLSKDIRAGLNREIIAVRNAYMNSSDDGAVVAPSILSEIFETSLESSRLGRMATLAAENQYSRAVHKQYFQFDESSSREHMAAISSAIADRKVLCDVCQSTAEQLSAFLLAFDKKEEERPTTDAFWPRGPPRPTDRDAYIDGQRFISPEDLQPEDRLPSNVIQHHSMTCDLVSSAETCPLCEILRIACILDSFRERGRPFDHSREPLAKILESIRRGKGSILFHRILDQLRSSRDPLFLMLWKEDDLNATTSTSFTLGHLQLLWK